MNQTSATHVWSRLTPARAKTMLAKLGPLIGLIFVWLLFAGLVGQEFTSWGNQRLMLLQTTVVAIAAIGATLIIISGGIDLSVGASIALGTMIIALLLHDYNVPPIVALLGGVLGGVITGIAIGATVVGHVGRVAGVVFGVVTIWWLWSAWGWHPGLAILPGVAVAAVIITLNELFIKKVELSPFIVTLGMWGTLRGLAKALGDNQPIYPEQTWITGLMNTGETGLTAVMAPGIWIMIALALTMGAVLRYTRFGRHVFAIGSNEQTARLCGINVERTKILIYAIGIGCAGLAAVMQFAFLYGQGDPTTALGYELRVIAAVVIGGASLAGGEGSILGTIVGALIMTVVDNGCTKLGLANYVQEIVTGGIIIAAVMLDRLRQRRKS